MLGKYQIDKKKIGETLKNIFNVILLNLFFVSLLNLTYAKDAPRHNQDIKSVTGLVGKTEAGNKRLEKCLNVFAHQIDNIKSFYKQKINDENSEFKEFTYGKFSHRLFFHWGFNGDPRNHDPLTMQVKKCNWDTQKEDRFYKILILEQKKRNRKMLKAVKNNIGIIGGRDSISGLTAIIYDVHILGDFEESSNSSTRKALMDINLLKGDIAQNLSKLFDYKAANHIIKKLNLSNQYSDQNIAKYYLNILSNEFPIALSAAKEGRYKRIMEKKGITIIKGHANGR